MRNLFVLPQHLLERSVALSDLLLPEARAQILLSGGCSDRSIMAFRSGSHDMMIDMMKHALTTATVVALIVLLILVQTTSPSTAGPLGILAVFFLLYIFIVGITTWFLFSLSTIALIMARATRQPLFIQPQSLKKSYYRATVVSLAPVMFIGMESVGTVGVVEIILILLFILIGLFYIQKQV